MNAYLQRRHLVPRCTMNGISLVSVMVGLVISMFCCVAMMQIFKSATATVVNSRANSTADAQLNAALNQIGVVVEDAGYGVSTPAYGTNLQVISSASMVANKLSGAPAAVGSSGNAVVWSYKSGGALTCAGIYSPRTSPFGLISVGPVACTDLANWSSLTWPTTVFTGSSTLGLTFVTGNAPCAPFGITHTSSIYSLTVTSTNAAGQNMSMTHCLFNFH